MQAGECRNEQAGDWKFDNDESPKELTVTSVDLGDWRYNFLVQFHETIESLICFHRGITDEAVSAFDEQFEKERAEGQHGETDEDGDDPRAPYRKEHFTATNIERMMAAELGVDWKLYEDAIEKYFQD
jgi:hypothetical protein